MQRSRLASFAAFVLVLSFCLSVTEAEALFQISISFGPLFTVDSVADTHDANPGDLICADSNGRCTLRAAIEESDVEPVANVTSLNVIIFALPDPSVIHLTLGEIPITSGVRIIGPGARRLTVERSPAPGTEHFRLFRVATGGPSAEITRMSIGKGNAGSGDGGGILVEAQSGLTLQDVAVVENSAANGGGIANAGSLFMNRVLVYGNSATGNGGGILNLASFIPRISNSTITGNGAFLGGGIYNRGTLTLVNNTIARNEASATGKSIFNESGGVNVLNTIIGDDSPALSGTSLSGAFASLGNNLVTDARNSTGFTNGISNDKVSNANAISVRLGVLANNGGHTDTLPLQPNSPAFNAGNDCVLSNSCQASVRGGSSSDQRVGYTRKFFSAVDIGAFEYGPTPSAANITFGAFPRVDDRGMFGGGVAVLTSATTNEKRYAAVHPSGRFTFRDLPRDVYILDVRAKRAFTRSGPIPLGLDELPTVPIPFRTDPTSTTESFPGFIVTIEEQKPQ